MAMLNAKHVGTRQSSRLLYRPVYKEVFSPPGVTDEPQNVFHDALLNYQKHPFHLLIKFIINYMECLNVLIKYF